MSSSRIHCDLEKLGDSINRKSFKKITNLPFALNSRITSGYYGNVYTGSLNLNLKTENLKSLQKPKNFTSLFVIKIMNNTKYNLRDIKYLEKMQPIVKANICPSFPIIYGSFIIQNADFIGINGKGVPKLKNLDNKINQGTALGLMMEYLGNTTLENYIFYKPNFNELQKILFQTYAGIYALIKYGKMNHNDFHFKNVMLFKLPKPENYRYIIDDVIYEIKNVILLPIIIDINGNLYGENVSQLRDIKRLQKQINEHIPALYKKININTNTRSIKQFFKLNFNNLKTSDYNTSTLFKDFVFI